MKLRESLERLRVKGVPPVIFMVGADAYFCSQVVRVVRSILEGDARKSIVWCEWEKPEKEARLLLELVQVDLRFPLKVHYIRSADKIPTAPVERFLDKPVKNTHLLIQFEKVPEKLQRRALLIDCEELSERKGEVEAWLIEEAQALDFKLHESTARFLVATHGNDLCMLHNELEKISYLFPKREVMVGDVSAFLFSMSGISIPKLQTILIHKDKKALMEMLREADQDQNLIGFVGMLFSFLDRWIVVRSVKSPDPKDVAQVLGKSPFMVRLDRDNSKAFRAMTLWRATRLLAEADRALKSGQTADVPLTKAVAVLCET